MSRVTNVVITTGPLDWAEEPDAGIHAVQAWLEANGQPKLAEISDKASGRKVFEAELWAGAFNHVDEDGLLAKLKSAPWQDPEFVSIIWIPQEAPPTVWRGDAP